MTTIAVIEDDLPIGNLLEEVLTKRATPCAGPTPAPRPCTFWSGKSPTWPCWT